jgi:hypothetical protein
MTKFVGRRGELFLSKESSRGTGTVANPIFIPRSTISFDDKAMTAREQEGIGKIADSDALFVTNRYAEGEFESNLNDKTFGVILSSLLGTSPVTTGGPTYVHTYTLNNSNQHQSLSLLYQDPDTVKLFPLAVVDSLQISVEMNGIVNCTVSVKSRYGRDWTRQTATLTDLGNKFLHQHLAFKTATNVAGLAAASAIPLKKLELTISANAMHDMTIGTAEPDDILNQQFSVEANIELLKQDESYRQLMLDGTYKAVDMTLQGSATSKLQMQFPRVDFSEWEQDRELDTIVSQSIQLKGNYDAANALDIISTCILTNTYAGTGY